MVKRVMGKPWTNINEHIKRFPFSHIWFFHVVPSRYTLSCGNKNDQSFFWSEFLPIIGKNYDKRFHYRRLILIRKQNHCIYMYVCRYMLIKCNKCHPWTVIWSFTPPALTLVRLWHTQRSNRYQSIKDNICLKEHFISYSLITRIDLYQNWSEVC